ncbi:LPXTG cell wall anchor domain-containing protein [Companilactobacillus versmoldensis]
MPASNKGSQKLPQTGNKLTYAWSLLGVSLLGIFGLAFRKIKHWL